MSRIVRWSTPVEEVDLVTRIDDDDEPLWLRGAVR